MAKKIYKYFSEHLLDIVFTDPAFCRVKCSYPKDYHDPYELFLSVNLNVPTEYLATYQEVIETVPQLPTTCFSLSPIVTPMWAHYAGNHCGFVVEFDCDRIHSEMDDVRIQNVDYKSEASQIISESLARAAVARKPRHVVWLQQAVLSEAYFSKYTTWQYEQECRLLAPRSRIEDISGHLILPLPSTCVTAIIAGSRSSEALEQRSKRISEDLEIEWYKSTIGKTHPLPYLVSGDDARHTFSGKAIERSANNCESCQEPIPLEEALCSWCRITEEHATEAARGNPYRALERYGLLGEYLAGIARIEKNRRK